MVAWPHRRRKDLHLASLRSDQVITFSWNERPPSRGHAGHNAWNTHQEQERQGSTKAVRSTR